jgi:hypothetical protein
MSNETVKWMVKNRTGNKPQILIINVLEEDSPLGGREYFIPPTGTAKFYVDHDQTVDIKTGNNDPSGYCLALKLKNNLTDQQRNAVQQTHTFTVAQGVEKWNLKYSCAHEGPGSIEETTVNVEIEPDDPEG